jgi:hypothetical protein
MTRLAGASDRSEIILDPAEAWRRGRVLDRMLAQALPPHPRGVFRGTHADLEKLDIERALETAKRLNPR